MTTETQTHHFYWAKERIDEMDATLTSIEARLGVLPSDAEDTGRKSRLHFVLSATPFRRPSASSSTKGRRPGRKPERLWMPIGPPSKPPCKNI